MERKTIFVDVILPLSVNNLYTYRVPFDMAEDVIVGKRVVVQFGKKKIYSAIIHEIHENAPENYEAKYIDSILDDYPVVNKKQLLHWEWMARYYMCTLGEVMNAALPSGLKLESQTQLWKNPDFHGDLSTLTDKEYMVLEALDLHPTLTLVEVMRILDQKQVFPVIKSLIEKGAVLVDEELVQRYKPKKEAYVKLTTHFEQEKSLATAFNQLEKAPKQLELLMGLVTLSARYSKKTKEVRKKDLLANNHTAASILNQLVQKGIVELYEKEVGRLDDNGEYVPKKLVLSQVQNTALSSVKEGFVKDKVVLLHGITSSGKTELYIRLIEEALKDKKQVLYLLPEIALTSQLIFRLRAYFGNKVGVYHSKFNEQERVEIWNAVLHGDSAKSKHGGYSIVLGARSALFLPFSRLGLVIVDEEHENSFKQFNPAPRYHARDAGIYLARLHGAKTLLGTATPAIETYTNALNGKYELVELNERYGAIPLPEIVVADALEERKKKTMRSNFTSKLLQVMEETLANKEQIILFQNRRGFSSFLECGTCAWIPHCVHCDVTLTYHKAFGKIKCHYCGLQQDVPGKCGACGNTQIQTKGFGTEMIQEDLATLFPNARVGRMDLDTTRNKNAHQKIINDFENRDLDILVGTQMVTKGLDFDNVGVVGILNADNMLNFPDFRSFERGFSLMAQVGGRAGRKIKQGKVIVQTYDPKHKIIARVLNHDFTGMYNDELKSRKEFNYPPFCRLVEITLKHKDKKVVNDGSWILGEELRSVFGNRVLGPEYPLVARVKTYYQKQVLLKIEVDASVTKAKKILAGILEKFQLSKEGKKLRVQVNVDPL